MWIFIVVLIIVIIVGIQKGVTEFKGKQYLADQYDKEQAILRHAAKMAIKGQNVNDDIPDQIEKLSELNQQGIITDEEFSKKKAELLAKM
jgi:hypothetical protein